jgi:hypothetical protein
MIALLFGMAVLLLALIETVTGKTYGRGGSVERAKEPFTYWLVLALQFLMATVLFWSWYVTPP